MKIPEKIRIDGVEYSIQEVDGLNDGVNLLYGNVTWEDTAIRLRSDMGYQHKCITMLHEITHALIHHALLELEGDVEEKVCEALGYGLYQLLQDNGGRLFDLAQVSTDDGRNE